MTEYLRFLMEPARIGMLSLEIRIYHPCQPLDPKNVVFQPLNHGWVYAAFKGIMDPLFWFCPETVSDFSWLATWKRDNDDKPAHSGTNPLSNAPCQPDLRNHMANFPNNVHDVCIVESWNRKTETIGVIT